jgi:hypothetical protein
VWGWLVPPVSAVRKPDGQLTVEARVMWGEAMNSYIEAFTLDNPGCVRRQIITPLPGRERIPIVPD